MFGYQNLIFVIIGSKVFNPYTLRKYCHATVGYPSGWVRSLGLLGIEVSQSCDILTSHVFVTPYWRSSQSLPDTLSYGADIVKVFI